MNEVKCIKEAEDIYDYQWYPQISTSSSSGLFSIRIHLLVITDNRRSDTAMFITTARDQPIHLYNASSFSVSYLFNHHSFHHSNISLMIDGIVWCGMGWDRMVWMGSR